eukprot:s677_g18.t1
MSVPPVSNWDTQKAQLPVRSTHEIRPNILEQKGTGKMTGGASVPTLGELFLRVGDSFCTGVHLWLTDMSKGVSMPFRHARARLLASHGAGARRARAAPVERLETAHGDLAKAGIWKP